MKGRRGTVDKFTTGVSDQLIKMYIQSTELSVYLPTALALVTPKKTGIIAYRKQWFNLEEIEGKVLVCVCIRTGP